MITTTYLELSAVIVNSMKPRQELKSIIKRQQEIHAKYGDRKSPYFCIPTWRNELMKLRTEESKIHRELKV